ncbi:MULTISPECIES: YccS family putative transporter [Cobetia]|uniref:YccS family putative transporter n=1 Tax=Cobetia TaxID=204286 RepID=UPI00046ACF48|nr:MULTISPECIES: YccS family putative transporter [Cobetia]
MTHSLWHSLLHSLRRLWTLDAFSYSLRMLIALGGVMGVGFWFDEMALVIPLFLGVIASGLAETDDHWRGRLRALGMTLACFSIASVSVELLFGMPVPFVIGLALATFSMIMLGAVDARYGAIARASLILAVYTMISLEQQHGDGSIALLEQSLPSWLREPGLGINLVQPLLLVIGATWYGLLSVLWCALFSRQPLKHSMAMLYRELGRYLILKAQLFEPLRNVDQSARRLALAEQNGRVVVALNQTKEMVFRRLAGRRDTTKLDRYLRLYFIAQDLHERASSSHYPYGQLTDAFFHHDILFRCQRLLEQQGRACKGLGKALLMRQPFDASDSQQALEDLNASLNYLKQQQRPEWQHLMQALEGLTSNLRLIEGQIARLSDLEAVTHESDNSLFDRSPSGAKDIVERIRNHLNTRSPIFRHALRLTATLVAGYGVLLAVHPTQGYWILLTGLFVCRPSYGDTRRTLAQRILGTLVGLVAGWALISLFPSPTMQAGIAVVAGVLFFATRGTRYTLATAAITLMVLACFNQVGDGFDLIWPRLFDTLVGGLLAGLSVVLILPDWQGRKLYRQAGISLKTSGRYLGEVLSQYRHGKRDDLAYRLARRNAHNADATFSNLLATARKEPGHFRRDVEPGFGFLLQAHTLLGYLSALAAHRGELEATAAASSGIKTLLHHGDLLSQQLTALGEQLEAGEDVVLTLDSEGEADALDSEAEQIEAASGRQAAAQLAFILRQLKPLEAAAEALIKSSRAS